MTTADSGFISPLCQFRGKENASVPGFAARILKVTWIASVQVACPPLNQWLWPEEESTMMGLTWSCPTPEDSPQSEITWGGGRSWRQYEVLDTVRKRKGEVGCQIRQPIKPVFSAAWQSPISINTGPNQGSLPHPMDFQASAEECSYGFTNQSNQPNDDIWESFSPISFFSSAYSTSTGHCLIGQALLTCRSEMTSPSSSIWHPHHPHQGIRLQRGESALVSQFLERSWSIVPCAPVSQGTLRKMILSVFSLWNDLRNNLRSDTSLVRTDFLLQCWGHLAAWKCLP